MNRATNEIVRRAYAKVNLALDIVGLREDGYHLVKMVMHSIGLYDILTFRRTETPGVTLRISEKSTLPNIGDVPLDDRNLIVRAAKRLLERYAASGTASEIKEGMRASEEDLPGVEILLEKHIPMAAGMAGGSTDCAATLRGVAELLNLPCTEAELAEIGVSLGADVPYCLMGGTALAQGIGEDLTRLPELPECRFVIVKPEFGASTKEVYQAYDRLDPSAVPRPDIDGMLEALDLDDLPGVMSRMGNVLEEVTAGIHPEIHRIEEMLREAGAQAAMMTGSGPTVFGMLRMKDKAPDAEQLRKKLAEAGIEARVYIV